MDERAAGPVEGGQVAGGLPRGGRATLVVVVALTVVALLLAVAHVLDEHRQYGVWGWSATSPTPLLPYHGREFRRGGEASGPQGGWIRVGVTWDGLDILGPNSARTPTALVVRVGPGSYVSYALVGGP